MNVAADRVRDFPLGWWITGTILLSTGMILLYASSALVTFGACAGVFLIVIGLAMVLSVPVLTISIDRVSQILQLSSRSLLKSELKKFRLQDIASIDADEDDDSDGTFRLVITESDGTVTPLRSHYGPWNRTLQRRLWELAGVSGAIGRPRSLTGAISILTGQDEMANQAMRHRQELMTTPCGAVSGSADATSVIQSIGIGGQPLTRWFSQDFKMQDAFLFIVQKSPSASFMNRLFSRGMLGRKALLASMAMHGLSDIDAPGKSNAQLLDVVELEPHFAGVASEDYESRRILNRSIIQTLVAWAERHPIGSIRTLPRDYRITDSRDLGQLAVLFGPQGVYAVTVGTLDPEPLTELREIGMTLIDSQKD